MHTAINKVLLIEKFLILEKKNINIENTIENETNKIDLNKLDLSETQLWLETNNFYYIITNNYEIIQKMANTCVNDNKIIKNKTFLKIKKIVVFINNSNNLGLDVNITTTELIISWILLTFSNKFVSNVFLNDDNEWFNIFVISNDFIKIINNYFIYSYEPGYSNIKEDFISNYELIMSVLMRLNLENLILKKVENINILNNLLTQNSDKKELKDMFDESFFEKKKNEISSFFENLEEENTEEKEEDLDNAYFNENTTEKDIFDKISSIINDNLKKLLKEQLPNFEKLNNEKTDKIINKFIYNWTNSLKKKKKKKIMSMRI